MSWFQSIGQPVRELIQRIQEEGYPVSCEGVGTLTTRVGGVDVRASRFTNIRSTHYVVRVSLGATSIQCNDKEAKALYRTLSLLWTQKAARRENAARAEICAHLGVSTTP